MVQQGIWAITTKNQNAFLRKRVWLQIVVTTTIFSFWLDNKTTLSYELESSSQSKCQGAVFLMTSWWVKTKLQWFPRCKSWLLTKLNVPIKQGEGECSERPFYLTPGSHHILKIVFLNFSNPGLHIDLSLSLSKVIQPKWRFLRNHFRDIPQQSSPSENRWEVNPHSGSISSKINQQQNSLSEILSNWNQRLIKRKWSPLMFWCLRKDRAWDISWVREFLFALLLGRPCYTCSATDVPLVLEHRTMPL